VTHRNGPHLCHLADQKKFSFLSVVVAIRLPIIAGAISSLFQSNRALALAGSIAALLLTNIVVLLSLPMGIWSLVVVEPAGCSRGLSASLSTMRWSSPPVPLPNQENP
jgi:hypothetical protein